jgi:hypothetical protein
VVYCVKENLATLPVALIVAKTQTEAECKFETFVLLLFLLFEKNTKRKNCDSAFEILFFFEALSSETRTWFVCRLQSIDSHCFHFLEISPRGSLL